MTATPGDLSFAQLAVIRAAEQFDLAANQAEVARAQLATACKRLALASAGVAP